MTFPARQLNDNEEVVLDARPHWWFCAGPAATAVLVLALIMAAKLRGAPRFAGLLLAGCLLMALLWLAGRAAKWLTTNFVVTSERVIHRSGIISKREVVVPLHRINTVFTNSTVFERILGAGDLTVESAGERGQQTFSAIRRPSAVQQEIDRQSKRGREVASAPDAPGRSMVDELERLEGLLGRGVLNAGEFEALKARLLARGGGAGA